MSKFLMPSLGADMESAVLMEWMVKEGDHVTKGQVVAEVETSKGVIEIEVFEEGIVEKIMVDPETECDVGTPLAMIRSINEEPLKDEKKSVFKTVQPSPEAELEQEPVDEIEVPEENLQKRIKISPAARKKARELGVDLDALSSKAKGTIHISEVETAATLKGKAPVAEDGMRQAIAKAMSRSNTEIPHYYLSTSINMSPALEWLEQLNSKRSIKDRILPAALLIRAAVQAVEEIPELNGFWKDGSLHMSEAVNPGIAIALRKGGLITPALLNAQEMSLDKTMQALSDLISRTRAGKLRGSELTQQSITITNLGDLGVERVYGVIYPPQVALVGLGRIIETPWAENDALSVQKVMQATLAGDHRATDGRTGALFLDKLNQFLQRPEELL